MALLLMSEVPMQAIQAMLLVTKASDRLRASGRVASHNGVPRARERRMLLLRLYSRYRS